MDAEESDAAVTATWQNGSLLADLPDVLLSQVAELLPPRDLASLAVCNKACRASAEIALEIAALEIFALELFAAYAGQVDVQ